MLHTTESTQITTADPANAANRVERQESEQTDPVTADSRKSDEPYAGPLLPQGSSEEMRTRWETIQTGFVDDPRASVKEADKLVASAIQKLAESFAEERGKLEQEWFKGNDVSTEDLRQALRRYRAFFHRLLSL